MKLAFITMVWRDYWLLEKWIAYNSTHVPKSQLYVINHGGHPKIDEIGHGCNVIAIPRDGIPMNFDRLRWDLIGSLATGLLGFYDRIVCTDVDELLVFTGEGTLVEHLTQRPVAENMTAIGALGLNLMPASGGDSKAEPLMAQFPNALVSGKYSKPCVVDKPSKFSNGAHGLLGTDYFLDSELLLVHMHYVTPDYAARMADRREIAETTTEAFVANPDAGLEIRKGYWRNWAKSDKIMDNHMNAYDNANEIDVTGGFDEIQQILTKHLLQEGRKRHVLQSEINKIPMRVRIPNDLRHLF
ncbi:MAG: hypothetical protein P8L68_12320 [Paracoccaceae bacterium]|nr:hypothetical protein [Paracoccaceae bacterium]MDG2259268.1 hypothetical protein [Paracoccaceae bacterium]